MSRVASTVLPDRAGAILSAIRHAAKADVILLAGKGHEPYQEIAGKKLPFSTPTTRAGAAARSTMMRAHDAIRSASCWNGSAAEKRLCAPCRRGQRRRRARAQACHRQPCGQPGDVFVALRGERFDAHDFLDAVAARAPPPWWSNECRRA
jgi:UDP-N-acetylmuramyl tripeptide synthase